MITITVTLPPDTPSEVVDAISVSVLNDAIDRMPRGTCLKAVNADVDIIILTFTS